MFHKLRRILPLTALCLAALLGGCVVAPGYGGYGHGWYGHGHHGWGGWEGRGGGWHR